MKSVLALLVLSLALGGCQTLRRMTSSYKEQEARREAAAAPAATPMSGQPGLIGDKANALYAGAPVTPQ